MLTLLEMKARLLDVLDACDVAEQLIKHGSDEAALAIATVKIKQLIQPLEVTGFMAAATRLVKRSRSKVKQCFQFYFLFSCL
jgi:hypothetical protein